MIYKDIDLSSNKIDTLLFGGGGTLGFVYLGLIKYLEDNNLINNITKYYGVSAGSILLALLNLGYDYLELEDILINELKYEEFIQINSKSILNIFDKFSIADSTYLENVLKTLIERKGFNPYINFKQLYNITKKELNIGFVKCFKNEFILANHKTRPEMPVWLAIRASSGIPLVFQPVIDAVNGFDFLIDGAIVNDNVIGIYLEELHSQLSKEQQNIKLITQNNKEIQVPDDIDNLEDIDNLDDIDNLPNDIDVEKLIQYEQNFICVSLDSTKPNNDLLFESVMELNKVKFQDYLLSVARKVFFNQDVNKSIFQPYIFRIDTTQYNIPLSNSKLDSDKMLDVINDCYLKTEEYFKSKLIKNLED